MSRSSRTPWLLGVLVVPLALVASLLPGSGSANVPGRTAPSATAPSLLTVAPPTGAKHLLPPPGPGRRRLVGLQPSLLPRHPAGQRIALDVFPGTSFIGTFRDKMRGPHFTSWSGTLDSRYGDFSVTRSGSDYRVSITSREGNFEITRAAGDAYWVSRPRTDVGYGGPDEVRAPEPRRSQPAARPVARSGDAGTFDVLFVYTSAAATALGGVSGVNTYVGTVAAQTNQALTNSGIPAQLRVAGIVPTSTTEAGGDLSTDLPRLKTPGDGYYDEVQGERDATHADLVHLLIGGSATTYCGLGYIDQPGDNYQAYGYSTSFATNCASNHTVTHELGHNLGADHDVYPGVSSYTDLPYAHGLVNTTAQWHTVMAYPNACYDAGIQNGCTPLLYYTNPALSSGGYPLGDANTADNARAITELAPGVEQYRQSQIYPGTVALSGGTRVGLTVTASPQGWTPGPLTYSYQWTLDGQPIVGATTASLHLKAAYVGHQVAVNVAGVAPTYPAAGAASTPVTVGKGRFRHTKPRLTGRHRVGGKLTVVLRDRPRPKSVKVVWFRDGHKLKHHGKTYRLQAGDAGKQIWARVTVRRHGYQTAHTKTAKVRVHR
jgi:Metallo-peptidase family M12